MKLTYVGPHDGVVVPLPLGGEITVAPGETADFPDSLGVRLAEQPSNWQPTAKTKPAPADKTPAPDAGNEKEKS
jgi:hypothetical protein